LLYAHSPVLHVKVKRHGVVMRGFQIDVGPSTMGQLKQVTKLALAF